MNKRGGFCQENMKNIPQHPVFDRPALVEAPAISKQLCHCRAPAQTFKMPRVFVASFVFFSLNLKCDFFFGQAKRAWPTISKFKKSEVQKIPINKECKGPFPHYQRN